MDEDGKISRVHDFVDVELGKPAPESDGQVLLAYVEGGVHAGKQAEVFMPYDGLVVTAVKNILSMDVPSQD